jgi:hypothetical protein
MTHIEALLEKYWEGETTLAEEKEIKEFYLKNQQLPPHLEVHRSQFFFFSEAKKEKLDESFDKKMLEKLPKPAKEISLTTHSRTFTWQWVTGIAAGILLFVVGFYFGKNNTQSNSDLAALQNEMKTLRETVTLSQLKQSSASERLKGVNYVSEIKTESPEIIDALIETLNNDENSNVRLAAANALFTFRDIQKVRDALVKSVKEQDDPAVKIALINMMIVMKEKKAKPAIEDFLQKEPIPEQVKQTIKKELQNI